ncbi:Dihydrolipoyllysine-residue acetyltransferase component of pyruvate dehydrogenase complex [Neobacillus rhizosphaerae]|uniref:Dihydrolipoamide acetyltransferase component of pyruvate dehydrogenase complex n=1 Tax=Neobacillus rhizosphaerae TaxID=2880965 RepID=A0ABN8KRI3_9BACI|nr:dihydrolipoamide acetyltransferase family protein [Neobacillus rhizosphaerae]CAH2716339.1 Dihydrolipoyllysine-residue acetyltransferase component of pyruvate dehydrogenase complex [Neobacillus rhizosphaerae]
MTLEQIKMPQLGESVTEGTISKWLVSVGDKVNKYDPLAEVMTDKVNAEVPSSFTGVIKELIAGEGDTLAVGEIICTIEMEGGKVEETPAAGEKQPEVPNNAAAAVSQADQGNKARYSPAVLKISQEHGIDLTQVLGTGAGGRITRKDLLKLIESGNIPVAGQTVEAEKQPAVEQVAKQELVQPVPTKAPAAPAVNIPVAAGDIEIPVTGIRKAIAANMLRSKHEAPHAWTMIEVDATNLVDYRNSLKGEFKKKEGFNLTFFAFFVKAVAQALKEFPQINSMWAGEKIIQKKDINISIAVATDDALYVPVIKNADEKTIKGIAREISELAVKVRTGKLKSEDMQGGTFTVNNTGSFGSVQSMGIINYPQAAILQVESIVKRPVVMNNGMIAVRDMVNLCMSLDHRVLDGLVCGRFLQRVKEILENISKSTTSIY